MRFKYWIFSFSLLVLLVLPGVKCQEKIELLAERNEIPHETDEKIKKSSSKPILVIKEPQYEAKTSTAEIKETVEKIEHTTPLSIESPVTHSILVSKETNKNEENTSLVQENHSFTGPSVVCPHKDAPKPLFSLPCFANGNCVFLGKDMMCCEGRCLKGVKPPKHDQDHEPIFFGIIERKCPKDPLTELSEVRECITDEECSPRICCGEILPTGKRTRYCRTPIPEWDTLPLPSPVLEPLKTITGYMQCTPPPPPHLDLYPKSCQNVMDCFPNLCCQEKGKKFCRPPKRSLLALVAELGQRIIPEETARRFIERIS